MDGFKKEEDLSGIEILTVKGWDYSELIKTYSYASKLARENHVPVLVHVTELTQPLGHSTSGSHERYKSKERLDWERENDCNKKMREWILSNGFSVEKDLIEIENSIKNSKFKLSTFDKLSTYITIAELNFLAKSASFVRIIPPRGPRSVLCVVVVATWQCGNGDGYSPAAISPAKCATSAKT